MGEVGPTSRIRRIIGRAYLPLRARPCKVSPRQRIIKSANQRAGLIARKIDVLENRDRRIRKSMNIVDDIYQGDQMIELKARLRADYSQACALSCNFMDENGYADYHIVYSRKVKLT